MATTLEYRDFILDQFASCGDVTCKPMMGEYLLYYRGVLFGGIYDNRLLVKIVGGTKRFGMKEHIPYKGAKPMYLVSDVDDEHSLREIVLATYKVLVGERTSEGHTRATSFQSMVYEATKAIPYGKVVTYADIAKRIGKPKAARAVGNTLHDYPTTITIPCHRVVNAKGNLAEHFGFCGIEAQRKLLESEGVEVDGYRVDLAKYRAII